jgi:class 3 adenylate cyclase/tetratricopeptide (TPR) repeat protein
LICPSCGQENPEGARFCNACGALLTEVALERREERKVVTVLFCDLVGSTAQAARSDPEDVRALLSRYHERVRSELQRFGGTVEKFIGDAVMALYGAPKAHEDDPERAVRAALAIRAWAHDESDLQVRIGITTGETVVAIGTRPELGEGMAAGDVVNTAARLQSAAPVNGILVDETTFRATERVIVYHQTQPVDARGKEEPVAVWEAVQERSRFGVDVRQIGATPLIGRERERTVLTEALARVQEERSPQLVTLVGVPGIGKSRLVWELFRHVEAARELVTWRQGRSLPYGEGVAFWALGEIVKAHAGIFDTDVEADAAAKLGQAARLLVEDERDATWVERHLRPLVGLNSGTDVAVDRGEAFAAWRRFLEALGEQRPVILVFEDLHFAEDGLLDFVDYLAEWATGVPLLIVGTARPELLTRRPAWAGGKSNALTISLSPLSDGETANLVRALLNRSVLDAGLQQTLLERAGGNPLYAEEFARLVAAGRQPAELPETVQGIVAARLDLLPADEKRVLQDASVIGKVFWLGALAATGGAERRPLEERLHALERKEFFRRERAPSVAGETEYAFRHILVRDVAYGQIPRPERAAKHRLAAEWIESLARPDDHADLLAHHYFSALELASATGAETTQYAERGRVALRDAGHRALGLHAYPSAIRFYETAIGLWPDDGAELPELLFGFGRALAAAGDPRADGALQRARDALIALGAGARAAEACALLAEFCWYRRQRERSRRYLDEAGQLVGAEGASSSKAWVLSELSRYLMLAGENETAIRVGREALAMAEMLGLDDVRARALNNIGSTRCATGDAGGIGDLEQSVAIANALNSPEVARAYNNLSTVLGNFGHIGRSLELRRHALRAAERFGNRSMARFSTAALLFWDHATGNWNDYHAQARAFLEESERTGGWYQDAYVYSHLAQIATARAEEADAGALAQRAVELAREAGDPQVVLPVFAEVAFVEVELGNLDSARSHAEVCLREEAKYVSGVVPAESSLALVAIELGIEYELRARVEAAPAEDRWVPPLRAMLDCDYLAAAELYGQMALRPLEAHARLRAAEQLRAKGRHAEGGEQLERALAFFRSVAAVRYVRRGEALLAARAGGLGGPEEVHDDSSDRAAPGD